MRETWRGLSTRLHSTMKLTTLMITLSAVKASICPKHTNTRLPAAVRRQTSADAGPSLLRRRTRFLLPLPTKGAHANQEEIAEAPLLSSPFLPFCPGAPNSPHTLTKPQQIHNPGPPDYTGASSPDLFFLSSLINWGSTVTGPQRLSSREDLANAPGLPSSLTAIICAGSTTAGQASPAANSPVTSQRAGECDGEVGQSVLLPLRRKCACDRSTPAGSSGRSCFGAVRLKRSRFGRPSGEPRRGREPSLIQRIRDHQYSGSSQIQHVPSPAETATPETLDEGTLKWTIPILNNLQTNRSLATKPWPGSVNSVHNYPGDVSPGCAAKTHEPAG